MDEPMGLLSLVHLLEALAPWLLLALVLFVLIVGSLAHGISEEATYRQYERELKKGGKRHAHV